MGITARTLEAHFAFFFTLRNELTPNHVKVSVKQIASATRPKPTFPA